MKKIWLKIFAFIALFVVTERLCHKATDGFKINNIRSDLAFDVTRETASPSPQEMQAIVEILSQPFTYLGSGGQAYAFLSQDKKTVLKFFKHHHLHSPFSSSEKERAVFFESCKLSFDLLRDETALLFAHLNKSSSWSKKVTLIDKLGISHTLDLGDLEFVLQKRASLALPAVKKLVRTQKKEEAREAISAIVSLIARRCEKGIKDHDNGMRRNMGMLEGDAVSIDIGSFSKDPKLAQKAGMHREIKEKTWRLERFLKRSDPELWNHYEKAVSAAVESKGK